MVAIRITSLLAVATAFISTGVHAYGQIAQVVDANNFCIFLPPADSADRGIASTEWNAEAFCTGKTPQAKNAGKLSSGFIQSAHFVATDTYVQVTGQINPSKGRLDPKDEGGQYDIKAPNGSSCAGWKYYVNLVEPSTNTYCMRCCNDPKTCNRGISEKGCAHIIPGDYSGPYGGSSSSDDSGSTASTTKKAVTTTKKTTTKATTTKAAAANTKASTETVTTTTAAAAVTSPAVGIAADANKAIDTNTNTNTNTDTTAINASNSNASTNTTSNTGNASSSTDQMLSQNDKITEQSVNAADNFKPTAVMTLSAIFVTMALMISQ